uniref:NADH-ubiquinone oxidoreductase chain 6 n=1 Tax=Trigonopterus sp. 1 AH-2016 TaxID=1903835 RepID=A0A343C5D4_9CUCU|nr:NADH dehydrogenase subunit 6 [Trigonopterus sp. 1 AH-2016]
MLIIASWTFSIMFMTINHPLSMGGILLVQTIFIALMSGMFFFNFWFSYILFLVMIGGMLVMFIYMTSIASNEKFSLPKKSLYFYSMSLVLTLTLFVSMDKYPSLQLYKNSSILMMEHLQKNFFMDKFFNYPSMYILIALMIYLLITMIAIVKITSQPKGTLRQK